MKTEDFKPDDLAAAGAVRKRKDPGYYWPTNPVTRRALEHWRDLKVGVIIHWGIYTTIGQAGSWSLHREHLGEFTDPPVDWKGTDSEYQTWYCDQARSFDGSKFNATEWAEIVADAGLRYLVFTAKHHDGFAMYDTAYSNFKSTAEDCGLRRDILREVTDAARAAGIETGLYFSKADWHHPCYWDRAHKITGRFHNYQIVDQPRRWQTFVDFTHAQIDELLRNYGPFNVLWLDAGWVCEPDEPLAIEEIGANARAITPEILVVDREVHGVEENYRTPEQAIPDEILPYPWEACITMTKSWCSLAPDDPAKPLKEILSTLLKIVSRGGNYLIGIGPDKNGSMSCHVRERLAQLGKWLRTNGEGIYGSRALLRPLQVDGSAEWEWYQTTRAGKIYLYGLRQNTTQCDSDELTLHAPVRSVRQLSDGEIEWQETDGITRITLPPEAQLTVALCVEPVDSNAAQAAAVVP